MMKIKRKFLIADRYFQGKYKDTVIFSSSYYNNYCGWVDVKPRSVTIEQLKKGNPAWIFPGFSVDTIEYVTCEPEDAKWLLESFELNTPEISFTNPRVIKMIVTVTIDDAVIESPIEN